MPACACLLITFFDVVILSMDTYYIYIYYVLAIICFWCLTNIIYHINSTIWFALSGLHDVPLILSSSQHLTNGQGSGKLQVLMEEWVATAGDWKQSKLYQRMTAKRTERKHGARVWLTRPQLLMKYGSQEVVDEIVNAKLSDPELKETQTKPHPDAPQSEARQIIFWFEGGGHTLLTYTVDAFKKRKDHSNFLTAKPCGIIANKKQHENRMHIQMRILFPSIRVQLAVFACRHCGSSWFGTARGLPRVRTRSWKRSLNRWMPMMVTVTVVMTRIPQLMTRSAKKVWKLRRRPKNARSQSPVMMAHVRVWILPIPRPVWGLQWENLEPSSQKTLLDQLILTFISTMWWFGVKTDRTFRIAFECCLVHWRLIHLRFNSVHQDGKKKKKKGKKTKKETKAQKEKRLAREKEKRDKEEQKDKEKAEKEVLSKAKKARMNLHVWFCTTSIPLNFI